MPGSAVRPDILGRFWSKVVIGDPDECWPWIGAGAAGGGYGKFWLNPRTISAYVFAWIASNAEDVPKGLVVKHSCDNPPCCNPNHLSVGTVSENIREAIERGLFVPPKRKPGTHCKNGHEMTAENTYHYGDHRRCKPCMRERERGYNDRRNERRRQKRLEKKMKKKASDSEFVN